MRKISDIFVKGSTLTIYYDGKQKYNKFAIYNEYFTSSAFGLRKHKKLIDRYANYDSCICRIWEIREKNPMLFNVESMENDK